MFRFVFAVRFMFAASAILALAGPAAAAELVPFQGSLEGDVAHTPVDPQTDFVVVDGAGTGTQLGRFSVAAPHFVNTSTRTAAGTYDFTAANGDTLTADFTGQAMPTATPGVISILEIATITGGTGRFAGATGSFVVERLYDRIAGTTIGDYAGSIALATPFRR